jgi:hypothetical protein
MPDPTYEILKAPMVARNIAASRTPRLHPSAVVEYEDMISRAVQNGEISVDPTTHDFILASGHDLYEGLEFAISGDQPRPHWEVKEIEPDQADEVWTTANMTLRSDRWAALRKYHGSDKVTDVAFREEAARYGVTNPFTTQVGTKPGGKASDGGGDKPASASNPWSEAYLKRHGPQATVAEQTRFIKMGIDHAKGIAKAAGVSVFGVPLPGRKQL